MKLRLCSFVLLISLLCVVQAGAVSKPPPGAEAPAASGSDSGGAVMRIGVAVVTLVALGGAVWWYRSQQKR